MPQTDHYTMRPLEKSDLPTVARWFTDPDALTAFERTVRMPMSVVATEAAWADALDPKSDRHWYAIDDTGGKPIGIIGLESISLTNRDAVVPLYIERSVRNRGIGVRAAALLVDLAFRQLSLHRLTTYYRADNVMSRAVTKRVGFREEGCLREAWFSNGRNIDMMVIGLLAREWEERRDILAAELEPTPVISFGDSETWRWPPNRSDG